MRMSAKAVEYIAGEAARRYGDLEPDVADKLRRNIRRNFKTVATREQVQRVAEHYKALYNYGAKILPRFLTPPKGACVDWADIRIPEFLAALKKKYPNEPQYIVRMIGWYVGHYEYLR